MAAHRLRLGVNVDHVATIRNARGGRHPDPVRAAKLAIAAGCDVGALELATNVGATMEQVHAQARAAVAASIERNRGHD